jgi:pimeloyl-ACP methyl ester carboxylesterase
MTIEAQYRAFCAAHPPRYRTIDGVVWEYLACGQGNEVMVLLPGGFGAATTAFQYALALGENYRVFSFSYPAALATAAALADGVAAVLAAEGVRRAHVLGGSYSGAVAQVLLRRHPALLSSLILSHTTAPAPRRARWLLPALLLFATLPMPLLRGALYLLNYAFLPGRGPAQRFLRGHFAAMIACFERRAYTSRLRVMLDFDRNMRFAPADLRDWPGRLLLAEAAHDGMVRPAERAALQALYPQAQRRTFAQGRHADTVQSPAAQIAMIQEFLEAGTATRE